MVRISASWWWMSADIYVHRRFFVSMDAIEDQAREGKLCVAASMHTLQPWTASEAFLLMLLGVDRPDYGFKFVILLTSIVCHN